MTAVSADVKRSGAAIASHLLRRLGSRSLSNSHVGIEHEGLPEIRVLETGADFPLATLAAAESAAHALLDCATAGIPQAVLRRLDAISRHWLIAQANPSLVEIDAIAKRLGRPGAHFLSVNYEWGCSVGVGPSPDGRTARLSRTLDWFTPGLGRHVMAAVVTSDAGPFVTLTWPGFAGVLQAMAPGRFSAAINQAPLRRSGGGIFALDWIAAKLRIWNSRHAPATHVLRSVMETSPNYEDARRTLIETPLAAPATFTLTGIQPHEACVIERSNTGAYVIDGRACTTNHWIGLDHGAHSRGIDSEGRRAAMSRVGRAELDPTFAWLAEPVLNDLTRLALVADAAQGRIVARGYEGGAPATRPLELAVTP